MGSIQPREDSWEATWKESSGSGLEKPKLTAVEIFFIVKKIL
jgi:hypothetical protein